MALTPGAERAYIGLTAVLEDETFTKDLRALGFLFKSVTGQFRDGSEEMEKFTAQAQEKTLKNLQGIGVKMAAMGAVATALLTQITMVAARNEELGIVINQVGKNIGKTEAEMAAYEEAIKSMGITTSAARQSMLQMVQSNVDLAHATELARLAQDAAVIGQRNSSEAFQYLIQVVQQADTQMARSLGLVVDFQGAYKDLSKELGVNVKALTDEQMAQARVNEVLRAGENIAGSYEGAMESAGKKMRSMARHVEELQAKLGEALLPVMGFLVDTATSLLKALNKLDPVMSSTAIQVAAVAAGVLTVGGAFLTALPAIAAGIAILGGPVTLIIVGLLAVATAITAVILHLNNLKKASQETAAQALDDSTSYEQYARSMDTAKDRANTLSEELYDLANIMRGMDSAFSALRFQEAADDLERFAKNIAISARVGEFSDKLGSAGQSIKILRHDVGEMVEGMDEYGHRIVAGTDQLYDWLVAADVNAETARILADEARDLARAELYLNTVLEEGKGHLSAWEQEIKDAQDAAKSYQSRQEQVAQSAAQLARYIAEVAEALGLSTDLVREMVTLWGYTDEEMKEVAKDYELTGKELHDLTIELGLSRKRVLELNKAMGEKEIREYGKALKDAAEATGKSTEEIDEWAQAQDDAIGSVKALTRVIGVLEEGLEDATEEFQDMVNAYLTGLENVNDATQGIKDANEDHKQSVADLRRRAGEDIDKITKKYDEMLPDATTAEQRLANAGQAWDEWAHRALGSIDDVVSGDEEGWIAHIREAAKGSGIIQQENESLYDFIHRVVKAFYEGKIPGLIQTETSQWQTATAEFKRLKDEEIQKANEAAAAKEAAERAAHKARMKILREERDRAALGAALGIAEADDSLREFATQKWPGALGDMFSTAEGFQRGVEQGFIDLGDPQVMKFVTAAMADFRYQLGELKPELEDNAKENRELWKAGGQGAKDMAADVETARAALQLLKDEQADLEEEAADFEMFGEELPEDLKDSLADIADEIADMEDEIGDDSPLANVPDKVKTAAEEVDAWTESLSNTKELLIELTNEGVPGIDGVRTATEGAITKTDNWKVSWTDLGNEAGKALDDVNQKLEDMDESVINIKIVIETEGSPYRPTLEVVEDIDTALLGLPKKVTVDIGLAGQAAGLLSNAPLGVAMQANIRRAGKSLGDQLWRVVIQNAAKHKLPWRPPFWGIERAGELGGIGSFFSGLLSEDIERYEELNEQIEDTQELLSDPSFLRQLDYNQYLEIMRRYNLALDERNDLEEEYNKALEAQQRLEAAQARVDLLKTQLELVELLYNRDIDPRPLLEQIGLGLDASAEDWVNAMAEAMEQLAAAAEKSLRDYLGIHSRSEVMYQIGQEMKQGWAEGWAAPAPRMIPGAGQTVQGGTTIDMQNDFSGAVVNNGMDMAMFQQIILQTVRRGIRGY